MATRVSGRAIALLSVFAACCIATIQTARADSFTNDVQNCPIDRVCDPSIRIDGNKLIFSWVSSGPSYDKYNIRWSRPGRGEEQHETPGGTKGQFTITNFGANIAYTFKVQGCNNKTLGGSDCTPYNEVTYTTPGANTGNQPSQPPQPPKAISKAVMQEAEAQRRAAAAAHWKSIPLPGGQWSQVCTNGHWDELADLSARFFVASCRSGFLPDGRPAIKQLGIDVRRNCSPANTNIKLANGSLQCELRARGRINLR